jgi:predicted ATPase
MDSPADSARRIEELFAEVVEIPAAERRGWLDERCPDPTLRRELEELLAADGRSAGVLDVLGAGVSRLISPSFAAPPAPTGRFFPAGLQVSHYRVIETVGEGGMGVVVRARDLRLQRDVALKLLPPAAFPPDGARRRLLQEARAAASLDHPNLCAVYDVGEAPGGGLFIATAYCEGETLAARLRRGSLAVDEALDVAEQLSAGLAAAHAADVCHCDVKPANLILTSAGIVKLVDFGIARAPADPRGVQGVRGTLAYMAPEQLRGEEIDPRVDVWALGVVLLECLTGTNPFRAAADAVTLHRILDVAWPPLPQRLERREALQALLGRCLAADREDRFADAGVANAAIRQLQRGHHGETKRGRVASRAFRPLPVAPTRFIGREPELVQLVERFDTARLVTVTGAAGTGKTRLALEAIGVLAPRFSAGAVFVSLAAVTDPGLVASQIATELGVVDQPVRAAADLLAEHIGERRLLLVLDNFEQVVAAAPLLSGLLERCPGLGILVTSRAVLRLRGEHEFPLDPLPVPPRAFRGPAERLEDWPATALFLERARAVRPDLVLDGAAVEAIVVVCRHLEGLPLAIELAAAQVRLFPPASLVGRLAVRLASLSGGARDLPRRHRTLRDAIGWSYRLLAPEAQQVFRRAGIFAGGADLDALEAVCGGSGPDGSVIAAVGTLVEHSLLRAVSGAGGRPRVGMLETIREYALELLAADEDAATVRRLHAEHHLQLAEAGARSLSGPEQAPWLDRLEEEHDNFRAALNWAESTAHPELALRLGAALCRFWIVRGHVREGLERLNRLCRLRVGDHLRLRRAAVLAAAGALVHETGDFQGAQPLLEDARTLFQEAGDEANEAAALNALAWTHAHTGPLDRAERVAGEALEVCRALGDEHAVAVALHNLAWIAVYRGMAARAIGLANEAIEIREHLGDRRGATFTLANRARAERQQGDLAAAHASLDGALDVAHQLRDSQLLGLIRMVMGQVLLDEGQASAAVASLREALELWQGALHSFAAGDCLNWLAAAEMEAGRLDEAEARLAVASGIWDRIGGPWGRAATLFRTGQLARRRSQPTAAGLLRESLALRREIGDLLGQAECLEELAACGAPGSAEPGPATHRREAGGGAGR